MRYDWKQRIRSLFSPVNALDLPRLENDLGLKLPQEFREFLLISNGAQFEGMPTFRYATPAPDGSHNEERGHVTIICGIDPQDEELNVQSLRSCQAWYGFNEEVPRNFVAIGHPSHHAVICISTDGPNSGRVYLWEPAELGVKADYPGEYLYEIAGGFYEFLDGLEV